MAKFFFKKKNKDTRPMHSQVVGIVWISVVLLFIAALAIFLPKDGGDVAVDSCREDSIATILRKKEDSVYHTRRHNVSPRKTDSRPSTQVERQHRDTTLRVAPPPRRKPLSVELNSADTTTLQLLHGIGPAYARRIVRYRERLGGFTSKEQLLEVYGFTPDLLAHIAPYITVDTQYIRKIDINSVALKQLIKHPYIEYYQARDIVNLRNRGIRFGSPEDLLSVPSMADSNVERLLPYLLFD